MPLGRSFLKFLTKKPTVLTRPFLSRTGHGSHVQCLGLASCSHTVRPGWWPRGSRYRCSLGHRCRILWPQSRRPGRHQMDSLCLRKLPTLPGGSRCLLYFSKDLGVRLSKTLRRNNVSALTGHSYYYPGTFQQYAIAPARYATPIPDGVPSDLAAPLLCGGVTVYSALKKLIEQGARPGDWVVIPGAGGGLGHLALQIGSRGMGFRMLGIDMGEKEKLVKECGAEAFFDLSKYSRDDEGTKEARGRRQGCHRRRCFGCGDLHCKQRRLCSGIELPQVPRYSSMRWCSRRTACAYRYRQSSHDARLGAEDCGQRSGQQEGRN